MLSLEQPSRPGVAVPPARGLKEIRPSANFPAGGCRAGHVAALSLISTPMWGPGQGWSLKRPLNIQRQAAVRRTGPPLLSLLHQGQWMDDSAQTPLNHNGISPSPSRLCPLPPGAPTPPSSQASRMPFSSTSPWGTQAHRAPSLHLQRQAVPMQLDIMPAVGSAANTPTAPLHPAGPPSKPPPSWRAAFAPRVE